MDETAWLRADRRHHTLYVSGLVDTSAGRLLDVVPDRTARAVADWLSRRDPEWLARIGVVALDPHRGYANAVGVHLGHATLVVDHFHVIRLANAVIDDVRRRVQQEQTGHRGRAGDPLYGARKLLLTACEDLDPRGWRHLAAALAAGDPDGHVAAAWQLKQITRDLYRVDGLEAAREVLDLLYVWADTSRIAELRRFARTIRRWQNGGARLAHHRRREQRPHGSREPVDQTDQAGRPRLPQLQQLPPTPAAALRWHQLAHSTRCAPPRPRSPNRGVEPD
jgi:transposase